ncbi:MAG: hypothetical protein IKL47_11970 [Clostridia bacterium]|nr:hypothetical protein [Clostridia bacterium]
MSEKNKSKINVIKNIFIVILCVTLVFESIALVFSGVMLLTKDTSSQPANIELNLDTSGIASEISSVVSSITEGLGENGLSPEGISSAVKKVIYSDAIVNTIMSMSYPLLFNVLTNLEMMDFATNIDLYPTGPLYASKIQGSSYTCVDKDGTRKSLTDVLNNVGSDWSYMDTQVSWTAEDGTIKTTSLWNSIVWGVSDKDTFYSAMDDMSEGLRGVLEICVQSKSRVVNINVIEFLLKTDAIPINLDAATIYNSSPKSGYETCLVTLFNTLGLVDGEYPSPSEVCEYTQLSDIWKAILEPVLYAVEKTATDPVNGLTSMLINFAYAIESGKLCESMRSLKMDGTFHELASAVMGFENGEIYNLGNSLIDIIGEMGIDISGSFNNLLDGLLKLISKSDYADMPDMDMSALFACATATTLPDGNTYYTADSQKTIDFLIDYAVNEKIIESIINLTELKSTEDAAVIVASVGESSEGLKTIAKTLVKVLLSKLSSITA